MAKNKTWFKIYGIIAFLSFFYLFISTILKIEFNINIMFKGTLALILEPLMLLIIFSYVMIGLFSRGKI